MQTVENFYGKSYGIFLYDGKFPRLVWLTPFSTMSKVLKVDGLGKTYKVA